ncbi:hypothetical protein PQ455_13390 [Sphingomonas naphthae]|uniref:Uncharacterized protein n=1 Tax=Sphingomonas naphthae TaxID=1813468 RepID=A0ABY7TI07_9SPHN|nr:hypothetical protein [Sphingomonas naphthae]WCT72621.1 hypothetical protein PQ455_13390 [Sphingomonas naphthae]
MPSHRNNGTFVTERQAAVHALFMLHRSMSIVARLMRVSQITVRETLVQYQRNKLRDQGIVPPPLREMLRGDVTTRFGIPRDELGGRPAKHRQIDPAVSSEPRPEPAPARRRRFVAAPATGVTRMVVTSAEAGARLHVGFWRNLRAYAADIGAELVVLRLGGSEPVRPGPHDSELAEFVVGSQVDVAGQVDIAADVRIRLGNSRPLTNMQSRSSSTWTVFRHPVVQLETLERVRADGLRVQLTTGAVTLPRSRFDQSGCSEVGAVVIDVGADGYAHCRHILAPSDGDGSFQDLTTRVEGGRIARGCPVEALVFGDVHHAHIDPAVAAATWGIGPDVHPHTSLVDRLRPGTQILHDVNDFSARSHFDARDHLKRFAQFTAGGGDVRRELEGTVAFLEAVRRPWCRSLVVGSNHDAMLLRWLREADFREDPVNAVFFLQTSLALHRRVADGLAIDTFFEQTMRSLSCDALSGITFLRDGDSHKIAGVEVGIHGHRGADGRIGGIQAFERLGIPATIGHTHRPTTRGGIYSAGVCQTELAYASGGLTAWAVGHVVEYFSGARQHLLFHGGRFHA